MIDVVMFSSGAGSAMAAKRVADTFGTGSLILLFADVGEHPDNYRFLMQAARWVGGELVVLTNDGRTIWDVFRERHFLGNSRVDPCSEELKRTAMRRWLEGNCDADSTTVHLGFDWTEEHRLIRAQPYWEPWKVEAPLCWDPVLDKSEGMERMQADGIEPPLLTRLGFPHANCGGGCVKAGIKHFARLHAVLPDEFARWEREEESIRQYLDKDVSILTDRRNGDRVPFTLAELRGEIERGERFEDEDWGGCGCMTPPEPVGTIVRRPKGR